MGYSLENRDRVAVEPGLTFLEDDLEELLLGNRRSHV
jgi:hypothetical protein